MSDTAAARSTKEFTLETERQRAGRAARLARLERRALLVAICALVFLVSLPRLAGLALRENELDAQRALALFAGALAEAPQPVRAVGELLPPRSTLARRLNDLELFAHGELALRHGYLFQLVDTPSGTAVCAWPWRLGSSGRAAFLARPGDELFAHPNDRGPDAPRWTGLHRRPDLDAPGWTPVELPSTRVDG